MENEDFKVKWTAGKDENRIKLGMPHCGPNYGSISVVNLFMYAFSKFSGKDVLWDANLRKLEVGM